MSKAIRDCVDVLRITSSGVANAQIIISSQAKDMEKYAAEELQYHIKKISGATLVLNTKSDGNVNRGVQIVIAREL